MSSLQGIAELPQLALKVKKIIIGLDQMVGEVSPSEEAGQIAASIKWSHLSGENVKILSKAFQQLPNLKTIEVRDFIGKGNRRRENTPWRSYGVNSLDARDIFFNPYGVSGGEALISIFTALDGSGARPESINFITRNPRSSLCPIDLHFPEVHRRGYSQALSELKTLKLCLTSFGEDQLGANSHFKRFSSLVTGVTNLRLNFDISMDYTDMHSFLESLTESFKHQSLRSLSIGKFRCMPKDMKKFLRSLGPQLVHLTLYKFETSWPDETVENKSKAARLDILEVLMKLPHGVLRSLELDQIRHFRGDTWTFIKESTDGKRTRRSRYISIKADTEEKMLQLMKKHLVELDDEDNEDNEDGVNPTSDSGGISPEVTESDTPGFSYEDLYDDEEEA
jgi:hypothetical protein